jgi:pimeloyl-ACP methyl ester carboxylesterase
MKTLAAVVLFALSCAAAPRIEVGEINGAQFRVAVPENWNGILIMYCHGYQTEPQKFTTEPDALEKGLLGAGIAVARSGYAAGGWAIEEGLIDTQALKRYFVGKYGKPKETYITGHSMGGFLTMAIVERYPSDYDGGLALCGPLAPATMFMTREVFDSRVVFDYFFPGLLPDPTNVPVDFAMSPDIQKKMLTALDANETAAAVIRRIMELRSNRQTAYVLAFWTYILKELESRAGGNPFDNRNTIYQTGADDNAINAGVKRYTADPRAFDYLRAYYTPTGVLTKPLLAIHTTFDELVQLHVANTYSILAATNGSADKFVMRYVPTSGHCNIPAADVIKGLQDLREWSRSGVRPSSGLSPASATAH